MTIYDLRFTSVLWFGYSLQRSSSLVERSAPKIRRLLTRIARDSGSGQDVASYATQTERHRPGLVGLYNFGQ